jgi:acetoin utilization protein AcuC
MERNRVQISFSLTAVRLICYGFILRPRQFQLHEQEGFLAPVNVKSVGSVFIYSEEMGWFDFGPDHPFKPERAAKTYDLCNRYGVLNHPWMRVHQPKPIDPDLLTLFHEPEYLALLEDAGKGKVRLEMLERGIGTQDNPILPGIYEWSLLAAGGTQAGMNALMADRALVAFNPVGGFHHAMPGHAEGFCYLNDIAISIRHALKMSTDKKIAYVDLDAHHGNGVQHAFYEDPRVLVISVHESGRTLYPWSGNETETGSGDGEGFTMNVPLEPGSDDEVYDVVMNGAVIPMLERYAPDLIVAEIGADTLISDPLTHLKLTNNGYQKALKGIKAVCPRILALGGGGYDLYRTARCWTLAWAIMNDVQPVDEFAGLVGGMMFGPEMEVGSLYDHPYRTTGDVKEKAMSEARRVVEFLQKNLLQRHNAAR